MISLEGHDLVFRFSEVHEDAICKLNFQRTLRIPDDGKTYPLPAGLGSFDLLHIDDVSHNLPHALTQRGGVIMPMWQAEAMWIAFEAGYRSFSAYPFAIKIATGKINALTGKPWNARLKSDPQDYLVVPRQPWLDGYCVSKGIIRQFVAAPLGSGVTVEEQITGEAEHGGLQIVAYPMKRDVYFEHFSWMPEVSACVGYRSLDMGLGMGGRMRQEIYDDPFGIDVWDQLNGSRCFVTILNAAAWAAITGAKPPRAPISMKEYQDHGTPWFDYYAADQKALQGSSTLASLKSIGQFPKLTQGETPNGTSSPKEPRVISVGPDRRPVREPGQVREGSF